MSKNMKDRMSSVLRVPSEKTVIIVLTAGFIAAGGIIGLVNENRVDSYNAAYEQTAQVIEELNAQIESSGEESNTVEDVQPKLNSAAVAGDTVAKYQTEYKNALESEDTNDYKNTFGAINQYISDANYCSPWFDVTRTILNYTWNFNTTYGFSGDSVPVLWTCYEEKGSDLLAYATGTYSAEKNTFSGIEFHITSAGNAYVEKQYSFTDDSSQDDSDAMDNVNDILDSMRSNASASGQSANSVSETNTSTAVTEETVTEDESSR